MFTTSRAALVSKRYVRTSVLGVFLALVVSTHAVAEPLAIGAVEKYDAKTSTLSVLGQQFNVRSAVLTAGAKTFAVSRASSLATSNALVRIDGTRAPNG